MSMQDILAKLIEEERTRCEEEVRKVLLNLCGLGAMASMQGRHADAAGYYKEALSRETSGI
jgi:hypothetical protein